MHHTYEVIEAKGWIQREFNPKSKVLADTIHSVAHREKVHKQSARAAR